MANLSLKSPRKLEIGNNHFASNVVLIGEAYCRTCGSCAHKRKDTDRKKSKGPSKAVVSKEEKGHLKLAREFGPDTAVNGEEKDLFVVVKKMTKGIGADVVVEIIGSPNAVGDPLHLAQQGGRILILSRGIRGRVPALLDTRKIIARELKVEKKVLSNQLQVQKLCARPRLQIKKQVIGIFKRLRGLRPPPYGS
jgi:threonine dehydrogenase-like Zn-dependent dehydrogenase